MMDWAPNCTSPSVPAKIVPISNAIHCRFILSRPNMARLRKGPQPWNASNVRPERKDISMVFKINVLQSVI
jgi:hypothetical protein